MDKKEMIRLLKVFILEQELGVSVFQKVVKKFTPNQGGIYLPRNLIGRTVTITIMPEESERLKKIEKARDELLKLSIKREESEEIKDSEFDSRPYKKTTVEGPGEIPDRDRFKIDLSPK